MRIAFVGAGAVGGFYGALLARQGHDVSFVARGAHLEAIRTNGLRVIGPLGDFTVATPASSDPRDIGEVEYVIHTVKTYDNATAIPLMKPMVGPDTTVLTLQNGVDSAEEIAAVIGEAATIGGSTYIATAIESPGVIRQTGTHRRVVLGEYFGARGADGTASADGTVGADGTRADADGTGGAEGAGRAQGITPRVQRLADAMVAADIHAEAVPDSRQTVWEKFTYLAPFAAFTGASRLPIGPLWSDDYIQNMFLDAVMEVSAVARAHGIRLPDDHRHRTFEYAIRLPPSTRSSLLIDLSLGKRIEVEALQGSVVRRGARVGVPTPIMAALYAVLKPWASGAPVS